MGLDRRGFLGGAAGLLMAGTGLETRVQTQSDEGEPTAFLMISDTHVLADAADYSRAQNTVDHAWLEQREWLRSSLTNTMNCGYFSSDRAIRDYAQRIWQLNPVPVSPLGVS